MKTSQRLAVQIREFHFGRNWPAVDLKTHLDGLTWQQATARIHDLNTIAMLTYHLNYYITAMIKVLNGGPLEAQDKFSFDHPPIGSQEQWDQLVNRVYAEAETFAGQVEQMSEQQFDSLIPLEKYGTYYRNIAGIVEHCYYHLGQIVIIRKMLNTTRG